MTPHLKNIEHILNYILENTTGDQVVNLLCDEVKDLVENYITHRDVENFIAYFTFLLSSSHIPKQLIFDQNLIMAFINRTYAECSDEAQMHRVVALSDYILETISMMTEITTACLEELEARLSRDRTPDLGTVIKRVRIGLILKWLQGPLENELSPSLRDYITFLATVYGQYKSKRVLNVDWLPCDVTKEDQEILRHEYAMLDRALYEAKQSVQEIEPRVRTGKYQDEFRIVLLSLDNLVKKAKAGDLDSEEAFKDKILVATTLMYIQDDFVVKDTELKKLIQLFVSLYQQFRDKHYESMQRS